jgi:hypothetical protein
MDPAADPVLAGKRNRREVPVKRAMRSYPNLARGRSSIGHAGRPRRVGAARQDTRPERTLRESDKGKSVEFYTHEEG